MLARRLKLACIGLCLLIISLWGSASQAMPVAAVDYRTSKDLAPPFPILAVNPSNFRDANHCSGNQNQGWTCGTVLTNESSKRTLYWSASGSGINGITFNPPSGKLPPNGGMLVIVRVPPTTCPASATFNFTGPANIVSAPWSCLPPSPTPTPSPSPSPAPSPTPSPTPTLVPSPTLSPSPSPNLTPTPLPSPSPHTQSTPTLTTNGTTPNDGSGGASTGIFITLIAFVLAMLAFLLYLLPARQSSAALLKRMLALFMPTSFLQ